MADGEKEQKIIVDSTDNEDQSESPKMAEEVEQQTTVAVVVPKPKATGDSQKGVPRESEPSSGDDDRDYDETASGYSSTTAVSEGTDKGPEGAETKKKQTRTKKKKRTSVKDSDAGNEQEAEKGPEKKRKRPKRKREFLSQFSEPDFYSDVSDFDEEKDITPQFCKAIDVNNNKYLILGPNKETTGRFVGPNADTERFGLVHPLNPTDLIIHYDPFLRYDDKACVRPKGGTQFEGYDGFFYQMKYVVKNQKDYLDYRKVWFHETLLVRFNAKQRERGSRKPKGFASQKGAPAFYAFPEGYIFFYLGKLYRVLKNCRHEELYFAIACDLSGNALDSESFNFAAIYHEDVDDFSDAGFTFSEIWMKAESKRKTAVIKKKEKELRILLKSPSQTPTQATDDSDVQQRRKLNQLVSTPVGVNKLCEDHNEFGGGDSGIQFQPGSVPQNFLNDVDEYNVPKLVAEKESLEKQVESLKAEIAGRDTIETLVSAFKAVLPSAELLESFNSNLENGLKMSDSLPSTELLKSIDSNLEKVGRKLSDTIPEMEAFKEVVNQFVKSSELLKELFPKIIASNNQSESSSDDIKTALTALQTDLDSIKAQFNPSLQLYVVPPQPLTDAEQTLVDSTLTSVVASQMPGPPTAEVGNPLTPVVASQLSGPPTAEVGKPSEASHTVEASGQTAVQTKASVETVSSGGNEVDSGIYNTMDEWFEKHPIPDEGVAWSPDEFTDPWNWRPYKNAKNAEEFSEGVQKWFAVNVENYQRMDDFQKLKCTQSQFFSQGLSDLPHSVYYTASARRIPRSKLDDMHRKEMFNCLKNKKEHDFLKIADINAEIGKGIFTLQFIKEGRFIAEYSGELISGILGRKEESRLESQGISNRCFLFFFTAKISTTGKTMEYCLNADDEKFKKTNGRWLNHDRINPSCKSKLVYDEDGPHIVFVARRDLPPGTMLNYDYNDRKSKTNKWLFDNVSLTNQFVLKV